MGGCELRAPNWSKASTVRPPTSLHRAPDESPSTIMGAVRQSFQPSSLRIRTARSNSASLELESFSNATLVALRSN